MTAGGLFVAQRRQGAKKPQQFSFRNSQSISAVRLRPPRLRRWLRRAGTSARYAGRICCGISRAKPPRRKGDQVVLSSCRLVRCGQLSLLNPRSTSAVCYLIPAVNLSRAEPPSPDLRACGAFTLPCASVSRLIPLPFPHTDGHTRPIAPSPPIDRREHRKPILVVAQSGSVDLVSTGKPTKRG